MCGQLAGDTNGASPRYSEVEQAVPLRRIEKLFLELEQAAPDDARIHGVRAAVYAERAREETSLMAQGIYRAAARDSEERSD